MAFTRILKTLSAAALTCVLLALTMSAAVAVNITIANTSLSTTSTRDGKTLTLGYQITSSGNTTAQLGATLTGPASETVKDTLSGGYSVNVTPGTNWYYRDFLVNLPPRASTGLYDATWTISWGTSSSPPFKKLDCLSMLSPISVRIPILMYHKIGPALYSQYWITASTFRAQMAALKAYGYTALTSQELMDIRAGLMSPPAKPVMLTFDGGYENLYTDAYSALASANYKYVLFLLTGTVGGDNSWDGDNNPVINFLTWDEVTALNSGGLMDLASHTVTHPDLTASNSTKVQQELVNSRQDLRNRYGGDVDAFCYPYGSYNLTVERACRDAGYFCAFAAWGGVETTCSDKWALKRVPIYSDSSIDYDPSAPNSFFFKQIGDPELVIPSITVNSLEYFDPATGSPLRNNELMVGQTVKVRLTATNAGPATDVVASLFLDTDSDSTNGSVYDSHNAPARDITATSWLGQRTFEWLWTVPFDAPTGRYYAAATFYDRYHVLGLRKASYQSVFSVKCNSWALTGAKMVSDGIWGVIRGAVVTAAYPDFFYMENVDRSAGLRVEKAGHGIAVGSKVDVAGAAVTNASGERCLAGTPVSVTGIGKVAPLGLGNAKIGGASFGRQDGVWSWEAAINPDTGVLEKKWVPATGLSNIGLLVRTWGRVVSVDAASSSLTIDDGSGTNLKCKWIGDNPINPGWNYVTITGISSCEKVDGQLNRLVLIAGAQGRALP